MDSFLNIFIPVVCAVLVLLGALYLFRTDWRRIRTDPGQPIDFGSPKAVFPLVEAYLEMGRYIEALVVAKKGVKAHPKDPEVRVLLARVYVEMGKEDRAIEHLQKALKLSPGFSVAVKMLKTLKGEESEETDDG